jgi:homoserine trans-succinylase
MANTKISSVFYTINKETREETETSIVYKSGLVRKTKKYTKALIDFIMMPEVKKIKLNESNIEEFYMMTLKEN